MSPRMTHRVPKCDLESPCQSSLLLLFPLLLKIKIHCVHSNGKVCILVDKTGSTIFQEHLPPYPECTSTKLSILPSLSPSNSLQSQLGLFSSASKMGQAICWPNTTEPRRSKETWLINNVLYFSSPNGYTQHIP